MRRSILGFATLLSLVTSLARAQPVVGTDPPTAAPPPADAAATEAPAATLGSTPPAPPEIPGSTAKDVPVKGPAETTAAPVDAPAPTRVSVGKLGFFQPSAQLQFWAYGQSTEVDGKRDLTSGFRLRRAELRVRGEIVPKLFAYNVMIDPSRALEFDSKQLPVTSADPNAPNAGTVTALQPSGPTTILQDMQLTFTSEYADVTFGQYKIPIGYEAYNSTAKLVMPEFALITRYYSARRDIGIRVDKKLGKHFYYRFDVLNGAGQNRLDNDDQRDGAARFEVYPIEGVTLGAAGYLGLNRRNHSATKDRLEADLKIDVEHVLVQAEYVHGWDGATGERAPARLEGAGFYAAAGYTIGKLQPIVRVGHLNPRVGATVATPTTATDRVWSYEAGANYFVQGNELELQLSGGVFDYAHLPSVYQGIFEVQVNF
jgi:hypothetical protein